jgi:hypothetical protein
MYAVIGLKNLLVAYATLAAILFCGILIAENSELVLTSSADRPLALIGFVWGTAGKGLSGAGAIMWLFGETPLFPKVCRLPGLRTIFPDLDGHWVGNAASNWPAVSRDPSLTLAGIPVKARIKARLLSVTMSLVSDNEYSESETLLVGVAKRPGSGVVELSYIYHNRTKQPMSTDSDNHLGAAQLDVRTSDELVLSGPYWTNRNWHNGLNTAGLLTLTRRDRPKILLVDGDG